MKPSRLSLSKHASINLSSAQFKSLSRKPEQVRAALARKKFDCDLDSFYRLDEERRACIARSEAARAEHKNANVEMAAMEKGSPEFMEKVKAMKSLAAEVKGLESQTREVEASWTESYLSIPNLPDTSAPSGDNEADNQVADTWGDCALLRSMLYRIGISLVLQIG